MKNKRGIAGINISNELLIEVIAAALFIIILFFAIKSFASIIPKSNVECLNDKWWSDKRGLKDILKEVDDGENKEFMFYNNDCNLVSFSFIQGVNKIEFPNALSKEPQLCLCKIEDKTCKPAYCYKFKNYDQINTEQFSTENLEDYTFLEFAKEGKTLRIKVTGKEKSVETTKEDFIEEDIKESLITEPVDIAQQGSCKDFVEGLIPISQDEKIRCTDEICCARQETVEKIEYTKQFITSPDESILIVDAARSPEAQRAAFLDFLAGGAVACGPQEIDNKNELESQVPDATTKEERIQIALDWLSKNDPQTLDIINNLSLYSHCRHIQGRAIDVQLEIGKSDIDIMNLRNLMCLAGWANYGGEWWHYEYLTSGYEKAKQDNECYFSEDKYTSVAATVTPGYA